MDIKYVSAAPGTGKTKAAIRMMLQHMRDGASGKKVGAIFYVAPTEFLLTQTISYIHSDISISSQEFLFHYYELVTSSNDPYSRRLVPDRIQDLLEKKVHGQIIFMTHDGFLRLKSHRLFKRVTVIFDESRHWVTPVRSIKFGSDMRDLFNVLFDVSESINGVRHVAARSDVPDHKKLKSVHSLVDAREFGKLYALYKTLSNISGNPRVEAYGALSKQDDKTYKIVSVEIPCRPFEGFREAYILSAMFTQSQMYNLLRYDIDHRGADMKLIDYTRIFLDQYIGKEWSAMSRKVMARYRNMVIVPLLANENSVLTMLGLSNGVVAPKIPHGKRHLIKREILLHNSLRSKQVPEKYIPKSKNGLHTSVVTWLLSAAMELIESWQQIHPCKERPLVFTNHKFRARYDSHPISDETVWSNHASARGSNAYIGSNAIAYLASVNADPIVIRVLTHLLNQYGYDPNQDYVVSSALQCLGRGNVRNHESNEKMLAIVPTMQLANYLHDALKKIPQVYTAYVEEKRMRLYSLSSFNGGHRKPSEVSLAMTVKEKKALNSIRAMKSRSKKKGDLESVEKYAAKYEALKAKIAKRLEKASV